jgi:hypothetical protein
LSRNLGFVRGVKRRCFGLEDESQPGSTVLRGRSFLETKWESEATGRRRMLARLITGVASRLWDTR